MRTESNGLNLPVVSAGVNFLSVESKVDGASVTGPGAKMWATGAMPPGMGTGSVSLVDTAVIRLVVSNAAEGAALRRCSANSFRTSNLVCAWLDAADRTSIAQKQARVVMRATARHPRGCGGINRPHLHSDLLLCFR